MDRGAWRATVHRMAESDTTLEHLCIQACTEYTGQENRDYLGVRKCILLFRLTQSGMASQMDDI